MRRGVERRGMDRGEEQETAGMRRGVEKRGEGRREGNR
jgi:hypothetical protein